MDTIVTKENIDNNSEISKDLHFTSEHLKEVEQKELLNSSQMEQEVESKVDKQVLVIPEKLIVSDVENNNQLPELTASNITASDDDFTSVTPIDVTVGESDKWSDIFDDTSIEEMLDSSKSLSLQKGHFRSP
ncbi:RBR-type E3 ubiquitin transferase [Caerostris extrusa]|uniref:RBR-type E3 ubiquitin transferase n=1 Tax=Caerostris extrusa TaxID=172846 RepID=A0AAV4UPK1_CAEEX|nr:RBR-type E3 ubiquitin transferase [Caerostris extrusa]